MTDAAFRTFLNWSLVSVCTIIVALMLWEIWKGNRPAKRPSGFRLVDEATEARRKDAEQIVREAGE